jgi:hypothetical protein
MNDIADWIRFYHRQGLSVIPLKPRSKEPAINWKEYVQRQPTDEEIENWIREYWNGSNPCNVGIVAGVGGIGIIDVDREDVLYLLFDGIPTDTWVAQTGKGWHVYLKVSSCWFDNIEASGVVEFKVKNKYCVAPPSIHPTLQPYRWLIDVKKAPIKHLIISACPSKEPDLLDRIQTLKHNWKIIEAMVEAWKPEHRNQLALWLAGWLRKTRFKKKKEEEE